jgi:glycosyltransferase involved in cell wall biosynthesis
MTSEIPKISAYVIAYNEEEKIADAVRSVLWADEVLLIDSFSKDRTAEIAESLGAKVVQAEFKGFGDLRNQAIAACKHEWIFSLDADERCTDEVAQEIRSITQSNPKDAAFLVPRKNLFMGRWIKHSGWYPNYRQPQLFKKSEMRYTLEPVHEGYAMIQGGSVGKLKNAIWQIPFKNLEEVIHKANRYSTLGAEKLKGKKITMWGALGHGLWAFSKHYILKKGFLDGWPGFVIALGNFEGTFYRYAKALSKKNQERNR